MNKLDVEIIRISSEDVSKILSGKMIKLNNALPVNLVGHEIKAFTKDGGLCIRCVVMAIIDTHVLLKTFTQRYKNL